MRAALEIPNVVDADIREALAALVKTYRTMQSGLIYNSRPENVLAAALSDRVQAAIDDFRKRVAEQSGMQTVRDTDFLGILVFLQRLEIQHNTGRRLSRAFVDFLREQFPPVENPETHSSLIV